MALNFSHGKTLTYDKVNDIEIYYDDDDKGQQWYEDKKGHFEILPDITREREVIILTGSSGAGKSGIIARYAINYRLIYPKNEIYMFSQFPAGYDPAFTNTYSPKTGKYTGADIRKFLNLRFVKLDHSFMNKKIDVIRDFENCLLLFDDYDEIDDDVDEENDDDFSDYDDEGNKIKKTKKKGKKSKDGIVKKIYRVIRQVLKLGRKNNVSCIVSNHVLYGEEGQSQLYRVEMNECHKLIFFKDDNEFQVRRALNTRFGLEQKTIDNIFSKLNHTRWICINKAKPKYVLTETTIELL
jgi:hypothetical protein